VSKERKTEQWVVRKQRLLCKQVLQRQQGLMRMQYPMWACEGGKGAVLYRAMRVLFSASL
jgi:hypothetical protein